MTDASFERATEVASVSDGRYEAEIHDGWDIGGNVNGGYLLATAARAMAHAAQRPDPITVTAHYLSPGRHGAAEIDTEVVRSGRRFSTVRATLSREGRPTITALGTFGDLTATAEHEELTLGEPPELPPPDKCRRLEPADPFPPPFMSKVDLRLHPDDSSFFAGRPSGTPLLRGWFRLPGDEPIDTIGLLLAVDSFPPTIFNMPFELGWVPTLELTAHVRQRPAPGWLASVYRTRFVSSGMLEVDGEVWDSEQRLVAQSRQIALMPRAGTPPG